MARNKHINNPELWQSCCKVGWRAQNKQNKYQHSALPAVDESLKAHDNSLHPSATESRKPKPLKISREREMKDKRSRVRGQDGIRMNGKRWNEVQTGKRNVRGYLGNHKNKGHECRHEWECSAELEKESRVKLVKLTKKRPAWALYSLLK